MANTLNRNYPVPERTETPDVQLDMQQLAEAIDADMKGRVDDITRLGTDTGWVAVPASAPATYSSTAEVRVLRQREAHARGTFTRASGNVAQGDLLAVFPSGSRPSQQRDILAVGSGQSVMKLALTASGELRVNSTPTAATTYVSIETMTPFLVAGA